MAKLTIGDKAPAFRLENDEGGTTSLKDFAGSRLVLYFYPKDDTPGCTTEACQFSSLLTDFTRDGVAVVGISPDSRESHLAFKKKFGLTFPLLSDPTKTTMERYGAFGEKMNYGKVILGVIRSTFLILPTGRIEKAWYQVRSDGHAAKVLAALAN